MGHCFPIWAHKLSSPQGISLLEMKLLIFTYFTEVSRRSVNIYTVLGKCKAMWATLRLGLNSKAENPPPIIVWAAQRTWAGIETEFRKIFPENFWLNCDTINCLNYLTVFFQVGERIWGVTAAYKFSCLQQNISERYGKYKSPTNFFFFFRKEIPQN